MELYELLQILIFIAIIIELVVVEICNVRGNRGLKV